MSWYTAPRSSPWMGGRMCWLPTYIRRPSLPAPPVTRICCILFPLVFLCAFHASLERGPYRRRESTGRCDADSPPPLSPWRVSRRSELLNKRAGRERLVCFLHIPTCCWWHPPHSTGQNC